MAAATPMKIEVKPAMSRSVLIVYLRVRRRTPASSLFPVCFSVQLPRPSFLLSVDFGDR